VYIFSSWIFCSLCLHLSPCSCHVSESGSWNELLFGKLYPNSINTVSYAVVCNMQYRDVRLHCSTYCVWLSNVISYFEGSTRTLKLNFHALWRARSEIILPTPDQGFVNMLADRLYRRLQGSVGNEYGGMVICWFAGENRSNWVIHLLSSISSALTFTWICPWRNPMFRGRRPESNSLHYGTRWFIKYLWTLFPTSLNSLLLLFSAV
jgi:hypothetical protein